MEDEDRRIGIFSSWRWLYLAVVVYTLSLILFFYFFTILFDYGIS